MRIVVGKEHPDEGYAVLKCGDVEVQIGYTELHYLRPTGSHATGDELWWGQLIKGWDAVMDEAYKGRRG